MPPCYKLISKEGPHPESDSAHAAATMPWNGLCQRSVPKWISVGKDPDGNLYSKRELKIAMDAVNLQPGGPPAWDAALVIGKRQESEVDIHIVFLQLTVDPNHSMYAKGFNQIRDAIPEGPRIHYHYVLVLLTDDADMEVLKIPVWRPVLKSSKDRKPDESWNKDNLEEYVMFVPMTELGKWLAKE